MIHIRAACIHASFRSCCILLLVLLLALDIIIMGRVISCMVRHAASFIGITFSSNSVLHRSIKSGLFLFQYIPDVILSEDDDDVVVVYLATAAAAPNPAKCPIQLPIATVTTPTDIGIIAGRVPVDILSSLY